MNILNYIYVFYKMSKIISLNFIKNQNNQISYLNPNNFPILFYWNGSNTIYDEMKNNHEFIDLILDKFCNISNYTQTMIYISDYDIENEQYSQYIISIQEFYPIKQNLLNNLGYIYIEQILLDLYKITMKEEYKLLVESIIDNILNIYTILKDKYQERINPITLQKYILSELQQKYLLTSDNCNYIIKLYNDIIS